NFFFTYSFQMIDRNGFVRNPYLYSAGIGQLISMYFGFQTIFLTFFEDIVCFFNGKKAFITKHIYIICQLFVSYVRQHVLSYDPYIFLPVVFIFSRNGMSTQKCRFNRSVRM